MQKQRRTGFIVLSAQNLLHDLSVLYTVLAARAGSVKTLLAEIASAGGDHVAVVEENNLSGRLFISLHIHKILHFSNITWFLLFRIETMEPYAILKGFLKFI